MLEMFSLEGKNAIVTGSSRGLGQEMCIALAKAGANIVGVSSSSSEETKEKVEQIGKKFVEIQADLTKTDKIEEIIETAKKELGSIDILINNAGMIKREDALEYSEENWDNVINLNLRTLFFLSQKVAQEFVKQGNGGKIINIASMLSFQGGIRVPAYTASKSAVMGLTKALANEWSKYNINVNAIAPGYMATDNTKQLRDDEQRSQEILDRIPMGRWGTPKDLSGTAIFLSSSASDYISGYTIAVDGGWLAR
ncbi:MAG: 2-dehydro-3-deoxy-D-gluconate 5-dehydrogenase KduD [Clostridia bacterium]|nr:2-dehydro-3-deoxy-D-gluconate 5-dehydrogenase KduD [Clostridia bacterium]